MCLALQEMTTLEKAMRAGRRMAQTTRRRPTNPAALAPTHSPSLRRLSLDPPGTPIRGESGSTDGSGEYACTSCGTTLFSLPQHFTNSSTVGQHHGGWPMLWDYEPGALYIASLTSSATSSADNATEDNDSNNTCSPKRSLRLVGESAAAPLAVSTMLAQEDDRYARRAQERSLRKAQGRGAPIRQQWMKNYKHRVGNDGWRFEATRQQGHCARCFAPVCLVDNDKAGARFVVNPSSVLFRP